MVMSFQRAPERGQGTETPAERAERIRHEAALIARARAEIEAGQGIEDDDLEAWLDELDQNPDAPLPAPARFGRR